MNESLLPYTLTRSSMASPPSILTSLTSLLLLLTLTSPKISSALTHSSLNTHIPSLSSFCDSLPFPDACRNSSKLSISITIGPTVLSALIHSLQSAISESGKLSGLLLHANPFTLHEQQRGTIQDCRDLHQITLSAIRRSVSALQAGDLKRLPDARAYLSAALTNRATCLEGLDSAGGSLKPALVESISSTYKYVSNSLSIIRKPDSLNGWRPKRGRRVLELPEWMPAKDRRILQGGKGYDPGQVIMVASDGSGNFTTIGDAINFAPNNSNDRTFIYVSQGVYSENVEIPSYKTNIVLLGDGSGLTIITGNRSMADGWTTFRSATVAVSGEGFLARDITFENTAGPKKHQAVALRVNADFMALYKCEVRAYQDSLYVHSFRQFFRECDIYGTIDYIFGNAAVVFQACNIFSKKPLPGQYTVVTAQSRDTPDEDTGISIQNCSILAADDVYLPSNYTTKSYLGRPWKKYSRTVVLDSYIDGSIEPTGWTNWDGDRGLDTLYYGEFENYGPGSATDRRVDWPGFKLMDYYDAYNFTVSEFITADEWLMYTSFPYDDGI